MGLEHLLGKDFQVKPWSMHMILVSRHQECTPSRGNRKNKACQAKERYTSRHWSETSSGWHWAPWDQWSSGSQFVSFKMKQHRGAYSCWGAKQQGIDKVLCPSMITQAVVFKACIVRWDSLSHWEYFYRCHQKWMHSFANIDFSQSLNVIVCLMSMFLQKLLQIKIPKGRRQGFHGYLLWE